MKRALTRLQQLDSAISLDDLRVPSSNRLEKLLGDRDGQWRLRFNWHDDGAHNVEIADYHH